MSIMIDLRSVIDEGVGASLTIKGTTESISAGGSDKPNCFTRGPIEYCCTTPISYELDFINAGECVQASCKVHADLSTGCVRCLRDFDLCVDSRIDETFFFEPSDDEYGDPYPVIDESCRVDIEPMLLEALLVEAPFAPIHDDECQGLCVKCGVDLNEKECDCADEVDSSHPFAGLKDLI